jgi:PAS domain S-box-containing protein
MHREAENRISCAPGDSPEELDLLRAVFDLSGDAIFILDGDGRFLEVNRVACERYGYARNEMLLLHIRDLSMPEQAQNVPVRIAKLRRDGAAFFETVHRSKVGTPIPTEVNARYFRRGGAHFIVGICRDATERVKAEEELREQEELLRSTVASMDDLVFLLDRDRRFVEFFQQGKLPDLFVSPDRFAGRHYSDVGLPPGVVALYDRAIDALEETGAVQGFDYTLRMPGGERWYSARVSRRLDGKGRYAGVTAVVRDITDRVRAEEEQRRINSLLAGTLESTADGILVVDEKGNIASYNRKFLEMWKIPEEVAASGDDNRALSCAIGQLKNPGAFMKKVQELYAEKDAESFDVIEFNDGKVFERYSIPLRIDGGSAGRVWSFRDVTERKKMEEEQQIFASLVENSTDLIGIASMDGKVFYLNKSGQQLAGLDGLDAVRKTSIRDFALEKHLDPLQEMLSSLANEGTWKGEARIRNFRSGAPVPIEMHGFVIRDTRSGKPIALANICRDISERKRMEEEMARADKLNSIGILAGGIAHDFNNLLTAIFGNITLAKMYANRESEVYKRLEESEKATLRAKDLTHQLLTFSKGGAPVKKTVLLQELVRESACFALRGANVKCEFSFPADLWHVEADEGQLSQVLNNLIINAAHAMREGGTIQVRCRNVSGDRKELPLAKGRHVSISIMDHGTGIPKEHLSKIFDPYFTTKKKGSGLGLSTTYSIVKNHGGFLTVESEPGIGTTFHIYLPASEGKRPPASAGEERIATGRGRILVMDDEEMIRDVSRNMLESLGYKVTLARDGAEAIAAYKRAMASGEPFDSVIMDLTVPGGMGGQEAVKDLLEIDPGVKAIVCSGYSSDPVMATYREIGFRGVVRKPYSMKQLSETIRDVLSSAN